MTGIHAARLRGLPGVATSTALAALLWLALYDTSGTTTTVILGAHLAAGIALGIVWWLLGSGSSGGGALLCLALLLALPASGTAAVSTIAGLPRLAQLAALAGVGMLAIGLALALLRSRAGMLVVALATAAAVAWPLLSSDGGGNPLRLDLPAAETRDRSFERVAVLGIDGADWHVLDPMIHAGELPTIAGLMRRGTHAVLRSIEPSYSPVVWNSIFTGMTPEQHGVRDWYSALAQNRRVPTLWELAGAAGLSTSVLNVPGTWPPRDFAGSLVSGFPIPQLTVSTSDGAAGGQFLGRILAPSDRDGLVPTTVVAGREVLLPLGREQILARTPVRHLLLEAAIRNRWLRGAEGELPITLHDPLTGDGAVELEAAGRRILLRRGEWSDWLELELFGRPAALRLRRLESGALYATPPFQTGRRLRYPIATRGFPQQTLANDAPYVVEGVGWKAASDPDMRTAIYEHLEHVERIHSRAAQRLADARPDVFLYVHTLTDRIQHAFWPYHEPQAFGNISEADLLLHGERVRDAYRLVDRELATILEALGDNMTVFLVSDHGAAPDVETGFGGHRLEGVLVAAGPGVEQRAERLDLSIYDVTPTILAGLGLPVARDMASRPRTELIASHVTVRWLDSFGHEAEASARHIDRSTEEQLRALGYVE
ncbi:MAG: alkaline phosphatase family protein [Myxococcota bacterium]|nr:alkaline phosphatase family protein [Myxococcota bacterium]